METIPTSGLAAMVRRVILENLIRPLVEAAMTEGWTAEEVEAAVAAELARFPEQSDTQ